MIINGVQYFRQFNLILNDCIQSTAAVCNLRQHSVRDKIQSVKNPRKTFFCQKERTLSENNFASDIVSDFQCAK